MRITAVRYMSWKLDLLFWEEEITDIPARMVSRTISEMERHKILKIKKEQKRFKDLINQLLSKDWFKNILSFK